MSKRSCLDNPQKPHKSYRDALVKRRKSESRELRARLTPALSEALDRAIANGRKPAADTVTAWREEIAAKLETALDGELTLADVCGYCAFVHDENERSEAAAARGQVSALLNARPCRPAPRCAAPRCAALPRSPPHRLAALPLYAPRERCAALPRSPPPPRCAASLRAARRHAPLGNISCVYIYVCVCAGLYTNSAEGQPPLLLRGKTKGESTAPRSDRRHQARAYAHCARRAEAG